MANKLPLGFLLILCCPLASGAVAGSRQQGTVLRPSTLEELYHSTRTQGQKIKGHRLRMEEEFRHRKPDAGGTGLSEVKLIYSNQKVGMEFRLLKTTIPPPPHKCPVVFL